jgi:hypothetical protein
MFHHFVLPRFFWPLNFGLDLKFACLREAASAKAGIL